MPKPNRYHMLLPPRAAVAVPSAAALLAITLSLASATSAVRAAEHASWHDFNGDGRADLAIGIPDRTVNGHPGAGAALVLYGSANGLTATASQLFHEDRPMFASLESGDGAQDGEHFGAALASGDFDDDGFADLAIGVPGQDDGDAEVFDSGEIVILWGSQTGLVGPAKSFLDFEGGDRMGSALVTLNFFDVASQSTTPDAIADLASVGANSQRAFVFAGGSRNFLHDSSHHCLQFLGSGSTKFVLAAGNTDSDPADELFVGQPNEPKGATAGAGLVTEIGRSGDECDSSTFTQSSFGGNDVANDHFGASLVAGNFVGSATSREELVVGVPGKDVPFNSSTVKNAGMVMLLLGSIGIPNTEATSGVPGDPHQGDAYGASLAAGNFDGDSLLDVAIGIPGATVGGKAGAGAVNILRGDSDPADFRFSQASPDFNGAAAAGDGFGTTLTAANFGHGGKSDLAIGSPNDDEAGAQNAGVVNVVYGSAAGPSGDNDQLWSLATAGISGNPAVSEHLGAAMR